MSFQIPGRRKDPSSIAEPEIFRTQHIDLDLTVDFDAERLSGSAILQVISLKKGEASELLKLDASALEITKVSLLDPETKQLDFKFDENGGKFGGCLSISMPVCLMGQILRIKIEYSTTKEGQAIQWLKPGQTSEKIHPYLFTQCQAILARSLLPCQDTPGVKSTYSAQISVPAPLTAVMSANKRVVLSKGDDLNIIKFDQDMPIPSYLIALAVGNLESRDLSEVSCVWAEPELLEAAAWEFAQLPACLKAAEELCGPYRWGRYDLLVLPPSFPYGGMENPCLTFLTPSLMAGDRSMVNVLAHEIAHSWTGNLVTACTWEHFWLNEGFTTFLERKIIGRLEGEASRHLQALVGLGELSDELGDIPKGSEARRLCPDLTSLDPDDAFSVVPYEKGHTLLFHIEQLVGLANFESYLRSYIIHFADAEPIDTSQWYAHLIKTFPESKEMLEAINWKAWLKSDGMPPVIPTYDRSLIEAVERCARLWIEGEALDGDAKGGDEFLTSFTAWQQMLFLDQLIESPTKLSPSLLTALDSRYNLSGSKNVELLLRWLKLGLPAAHEPCYDLAVQFVLQHGRMKYCRPIYRALSANQATKNVAVEVFTKNRNFYHPKAAALIAKDLGLSS